MLDTDAQLKKIASIATKKGLNVLVMPSNWEGPLWLPGTIITDHNNPVLLWHEICHWQIASAEQRTRADYGLGIQPAGNAEYSPKFFTPKDTLLTWNKKTKGVRPQDQEDLAAACILAYVAIVPGSDEIVANILSEFGCTDIRYGELSAICAVCKNLGVNISIKKLRAILDAMRARWGK